MKLCKKCQVEKSESEFSKSKLFKDGLYSRCKECCKVKNQKYYSENKDALNLKSKEYSKTWFQKPENHEKKNNYSRGWRKNNSEKYRKYYREYVKKQRADPNYRLHGNMSKGINLCLRGQKCGRSWLSLVDYTIEDLKRHLEEKFLPGMDWTNYGLHGWHVDHIIPKSHFVNIASNEEEFGKCWALENLQPMWAFDNWSKRNRFIG